MQRGVGLTAYGARRRHSSATICGRCHRPPRLWSSARHHSSSIRRLVDHGGFSRLRRVVQHNLQGRIRSTRTVQTKAASTEPCKPTTNDLSLLNMQGPRQSTHAEKKLSHIFVKYSIIHDVYISAYLHVST